MFERFEWWSAWKIYHFLQCDTVSRCQLLHVIQNVHNQLKKYISDTYDNLSKVKVTEPEKGI